MTLKMFSSGLQVQTLQLGEKMFQQSGETEIFFWRPPPSWNSHIWYFREDCVLLQLEKGLNLPQWLLQVFSWNSASFSSSRSGCDAIVLNWTSIPDCKWKVLTSQALDVIYVSAHLPQRKIALCLFSLDFFSLKDSNSVTAHFGKGLIGLIKEVVHWL